jgi:hypothetical protein
MTEYVGKHRGQGDVNGLALRGAKGRTSHGMNGRGRIPAPFLVDLIVNEKRRARV